MILIILRDLTPIIPGVWLIRNLSTPDISFFQIYLSLEKHSGNLFKIFGVVGNIENITNDTCIIQEASLFQGIPQNDGYDSRRIDNFNIEIEDFADLVLNYRIMGAAKDKSPDPCK